MKFIRFAPVCAFAAALFAAIGLAATEKRFVNEPSAWAKDSIETAKASGLIDETDDVAYTAAVDRLTFAVVGYNALAADAPPKEAYLSYFDDTDDPRVASLASLGIIKGKGGRLFAPDDTLTREEAATILARMAKKRGLEAPERYETRYADDAAIADWAYDAVYTVKALGLMVGREDATFDPAGVVTYEEAVALFLRLFEAVPAPAAEGETFADKLNQTMPTDKNYMFSPLSVKMALAMAAGGARRETRDQILQTIGIADLSVFNEKAKNLIETYGKLDLLKLEIANGLFLNTDHTTCTFAKDYRETMANFYGASVTEVDYDTALRTVNGWVNDKTHGKIPSILDDPHFAAALVNAIYFKGKWQDEFPQYATKEETFHNRDGSTTETPFMHRTGYYDYAVVDGTRTLAIPYQNVAETEKTDEKTGRTAFETTRVDAAVAMYVLLADERPAHPEEIVRKMGASGKRTRVSLALPKFETSYFGSLKETLQTLGMTLPFDENKADFTDMVESPYGERFYIDDVLHKTYIKTDEEGTEAAAVTAVVMARTTAIMEEPDPIPFVADRPFTYVIYDSRNDEILFMGEINTFAA